MEQLLSAAAAMPVERCKALSAAIQLAMVAGLQGKESDLKMLPSYVTTMPPQNLSGSFYALDLGGTNFRVLRVELGASSPNVQQKKFKLSQEHMEGDASVLFKFLAECIKSSVEEWEGASASSKEVHLGFTFSFPVNQTALNSGTLVKWTKGFNNPGVVDKDVVSLLQNSLNQLGFEKVHVDALANDTVGTLLAMYSKDPKAKIGVIFGTGTNACYTEKIERIEKWSGPTPQSGMMCINMEWGNFGQSEASAASLPLTKCDEELDAASVHVGNQRLEKLIGGMYLGELAARFFNRVVDSGEALSGSTDRISSSSLSPELMGRIESLDTNGEGIAEIMRNELGLSTAQSSDGLLLARLCSLVSTRAARVGATAIMAILEHMGAIGSQTTVGIDGSVYILYPKFKERMLECIKEVLGEEKGGQICLDIAEDGSGVGAALIAASAS